MTEQERPRTEAGRELISVRPSLTARVLAIEQAARTEGRQQAVREIRAETGLDPGWEQRHPGVEMVNPFDLDNILDGVAGLNASESPLPEWAITDPEERRTIWAERRGDASESGQHPEASDE